MEELIAFIEQFQKLDQETEDAVKSLFKEEVVKKNDFILEEGKICTKISFIKSGLVRRFYIDDGTEITKWIYHDGHWLTSMASYFNRNSSYEYLQACEDTVLYSLSYENEQKLLEHSSFLKFHTSFLRLSLAAFDEFHFVLGSMPAFKKYQYLMEKFPLMILKSKQKYIASLLNVNQETLSRIRAAIN